MRSIVRRALLLALLPTLAFALGRVSHVRAATPDLSHRYVVFIDGIAPDTNFTNPLNTPTSDPKSDFADLTNALGRDAQGTGLVHEVYFSYGAALAKDNRQYCFAWGQTACSRDGKGNLTSLDFDPTYPNDATHVSLNEQAAVLEWLLEQVVNLSGDKDVRIDIVGYSLGGVVASEWASTVGASSPAKGNIHSITIVESPVGGIAAGGTVESSPLIEQVVFGHIFGSQVLTELQLPVDSAIKRASVIDGLSDAAKNFRMTSIESTRDYLVNGQDIPICSDAICHGPAADLPIGQGTQGWSGASLVIHSNQALGGDPQPTTPFNWLHLSDVNALIYKNHGAPIHDHAQIAAHWLYCAISSDDTAAQTSCDSTSATPSTPQTPAQSTTSVTTEFVIDTSGSMSDPAAQGDVAKIAAAQSSADTLLTFIQQEQQNGEPQLVGLVPFNDQVHDAVPPGSDFATVRQTLDGLQAGGQTDIYDALKTAIDQAASADPAAKKLVILLTDGGQNTPQLGVQDFLDGPVNDAAAKGVTICTIGFGQGSDLDQNLLQQIASPDCGYAAAGNEVKLQQQYIKLRASSLGTIAQEFQGTVQQGQTVQLGTVQIASGVGVLNIADVWPGSTLKLHITDPSGAPISDGAGGVSIGTAATSENVLINQPKTGAWTISLEGVQVAAGGEPYYVLASTRAGVTPTPSPAPDPAPDPAAPSTSTTTITAQSGGNSAGPIAGTLVGGGIVLGLVLLLVTRRRTPALELVSAGGVRAPLRRGTLVLGRDPACDVRFADNAISGRHAQIVVAGDGVTVFDLGSRAGTFVNGRQVAQSPLVAGDRLRLGSTELVVWSAGSG